MALRYFRNNTTGWSTAANWSTTSGGAADAGVPTSSDDVIFDANSGNVTFTGEATFKTLTMTDYTGTMNMGNRYFVVHGNIILGSGMTFLSNAGASTWQIEADCTLTTNGKSMPVNFSVNSGTFNLNDAFTSGSTSKGFQLNGGILNTNNHDINIGVITFNSGTINAGSSEVSLTTFTSNSILTRNLNMASSVWTVETWSMLSTTNLTFDTGTSTIINTSSISSNKTFAGGGLTYNNVSLGNPDVSSQYTLTGNNIFNVLTLYPMPIDFLLNNTLTTVSNTLNIIANNSVASSIVGPGEITKDSSGTITLSYCVFSNTTFSGTGTSWVGDRTCMDLGGNSGITIHDHIVGSMLAKG